LTENNVRTTKGHTKEKKKFSQKKKEKQKLINDILSLFIMNKNV